MTKLGGRVKPQKFRLGTNRLDAKKRAGRIQRLWQEQAAEVWSVETLLRALALLLYDAGNSELDTFVEAMDKATSSNERLRIFKS
jgi:hypothetical protein